MLRNLLILGLFGGIIFSGGAATAQSTNRNSDIQIVIRGKEFFKDGKPWLPKGVTLEGFNEPPRSRASSKPATEARPGLDPHSPIYDSTYPTELVEAIELAKSAGFVVIISMDAQAENGVANLPCMPNGSTIRAWQSIAPGFIHDSGIIFEPFNEPCKYQGNPRNRTEWANTMQPVIDELRHLGATNILLLDGLGYGHSKAGLFPLVHDRLRDRLVLAVHPYLVKDNYVSVEQWRKEFGEDVGRYPSIASLPIILHSRVAPKHRRDPVAGDFLPTIPMTDVIFPQSLSSW